MAQSFADYPNVLNPECPWTPLREATGLPNVKWCEETLCSWIAEPANTWSNVAFLVAAAALWWLTRKEASRTLRFWGPATFWVGITSLVYHASVTFLTQVFDFFGMYFFFGLVLLLNLVRLGTLPKEALFKVLYPLILALTGVTVLVAKAGLPVQGIVGLLLLSTLATEVLASRRATGAVAHRFLFGALFFIFVAGLFSASDASGAWCVPGHHVFQGHAIWHVLNAVGIVFAHFHYRQFQASFV
ncbi:MAG: ceramidase domain-containing protein [Myxococcales bacterium]|nr:ceramidase domain-containing protein [Myxococcales bacterium]